MTKSEIKNLENRVADLDGRSERSHKGEAYIDNGSRYPILHPILQNNSVYYTFS